ncbi:MAG: IMP cyclohydrolase, partial [Chloroflexota bacterium]
LRHYTGVKYDNSNGIAAVSNGIQTEAIYEAYKLLFNVGTPPTKDFMEKLLDGAQAEPDSMHTPRIAGIVTVGKPVLILGIKTNDSPAVANIVTQAPGKMAGIATYKGNMDNPEATDPTAALSELEFTGSSSQELTKYVYDISAETCKGEDIRVCAIGGIYSSNSWEIAIINKY